MIYEKSDNLDDGSGECDVAQTKMQYVLSHEEFKVQFSLRGFEGQSMVLDSLKFGTSARRRRFWSVQVRTSGSLGCKELAGGRIVTDIFKTFRGLLGLCQRLSCGVESLLLPDEDPHVEKKLPTRTSVGKVLEPYC